jgi:PTS system nitrogen regulatory IIA component
MQDPEADPKMQPLTASVSLAEIFPPEAVLVGLEDRTKPAVIERLTCNLVERGLIASEDYQAVLEALVERERIGSTAQGRGIAFPHCRSSATARFIGAVGIEPAGISFEAVDGDPVKAVFLVVAPLEAREKLFDVLGKVVAIGRDKSQLLQLRGCGSAAAVHRFLREMDRF